MADDALTGREQLFKDLINYGKDGKLDPKTVEALGSAISSNVPAKQPEPEVSDAQPAAPATDGSNVDINPMQVGRNRPSIKELFQPKPTANKYNAVPVAQDEKTFTLQRPDGSKVTLSKDTMSPELVNSISKLQDQNPVAKGPVSGLEGQPVNLNTVSDNAAISNAPAAQEPVQQGAAPSEVQPNAQQQAGLAPAVAPSAPASRPISKKDQDLFDQAAQEEIKKNAQLDAIRTQAANAKYNTELDIQNKVKEYQKQVEDREKLAYQHVQDLSKMKITNPDMFADKSIGSKLLIGLGLFLGAAPNSTGQNTAVGVIQKTLDRNLDVQKLQLEKATKGVEHERNALTDFYKITQDAPQAIRLQQVATYNNLINQIDNITASTSNPEVLKNALIAKTKLKEEVAKFQNEYSQVALNRSTADKNKIESGIMLYNALNAPKQTPEQMELGKNLIKRDANILEKAPEIIANQQKLERVYSAVKRAGSLQGPLVGKASSLTKIGSNAVADLQRYENENILGGIQAFAGQMTGTGGGAARALGHIIPIIQSSSVSVKNDPQVNKDIIIAQQVQQATLKQLADGLDRHINVKKGRAGDFPEDAYINSFVPYVNIDTSRVTMVPKGYPPPKGTVDANKYLLKSPLSQENSSNTNGPAPAVTFKN